MRRGFNRAQRVVMVVGLGVGLYALGGWITTRGTLGASGWVAYAPLTNTLNSPDGISGLHPWVRLLIWLLLILVWVVASAFLLRSQPVHKGDRQDQ
jgi:hypothetical protein